MGDHEGVRGVVVGHTAVTLEHRREKGDRSLRVAGDTTLVAQEVKVHVQEETVQVVLWSWCPKEPGRWGGVGRGQKGWKWESGDGRGQNENGPAVGNLTGVGRLGKESWQRG